MSNLVIEVLSTNVTTHPTAKGSYQMCELAYKNKSYGDKVEGKKIMSFAEKTAFETLKNATTGQVFTIGRQKDEKGYWKWTEISQGTGNTAATNMETTTTTPISSPQKTPKSTYETPEERAARQVMIVRQSSISSAVALAAANNKTKVTPEEVIETAKLFESYVMGTVNSAVKEIGDASAMQALIDLTDDIIQ